MEDNFDFNIDKILKSTNEQIADLKKMQEKYYSELTDEQKKDLDKYMDSMDVKELNEVIKEASSNIINKINSIFNGNNR